MNQEPLTEIVTITLTHRDRVALEGLAQEHGATLRGVIRKLIRDAAHHARAVNEQQLRSMNRHAEGENVDTECSKASLATFDEAACDGR